MKDATQFYAPDGKRWVVVADGSCYADYDDKRLAMRDVEHLKEDGRQAEIELHGSEW